MTPCLDPGRKAGCPLRRSLFILPLIAVTLALAACGGIGVTEDEPTSTPQPPEPTATPDLATIFHNFLYPIAGACLPESDNLMPNAPRDYRGGAHEGVDFYAVDNCTEIDASTPVLAAKDGVVLRADLEYHNLTQEELEAANARIANGEAEAFEVVDLFRGRQVWIDHGDGIVTRYAHLSSVADGIREGTRVAQGQEIATVGDSGTPESLSNPGQETHLHWEVRVAESFLGADLAADEVRALYQGLFQPAPR
jgi:murein DD-endopeptidase MepM/ murein hydrolase activator NlpD